jgi:hypothetical protein
MVAIRAQVILHTVDAVPENYFSNSWCFVMDSTAGAGALLTPILKDFYDDIVTVLSPVIASSSHEVKYTELPGTPPNYPFDEDTFNFASAPAGVALPDEVAVCMSFQGDRTAGLPQARRRGRIYIGPLRTTALTSNRPAAATLTTIANAATTLANSVAAIAVTSYWAVWSQTNQTAVPLVDGWLDNACDTQRRRGVLPTSRTTFVTV